MKKQIVIVTLSLLAVLVLSTQVVYSERLVELAKQGNVNAQLYLAESYRNGIGGVNQDHQKALYWYRKSAEEGENTGIKY